MNRAATIALCSLLLSGCRTGIELADAFPPDRSESMQYANGPGRTGAVSRPLTLPLKRAWQVSLSGPSGSSAAVVTEGRVVIPTRLDGVDILNAADGAEAGWVTTEGAVLGTPAIAGSTMFVPVTAARISLLAVDIPNGRIRWAAAGEPVDNPVLVLNGNVITAGMFGKVSCFGFQDSTRKWSVKLPEPVVCAPAGYDSLVYVGCTNGDVYALRLSEGSERWRFATGEAVQASPVTGGKLVYAVNRSGRLTALNAASGNVVWEDILGCPLYAPPALHDSVLVLAGSDGMIRAYHASRGSIVWEKDVKALPGAAPLLFPGFALVVTMKGTILALDIETGLQLWSDQVEGRIRTAPVAGDGTVVIITDDGECYGYVEE